MDSKSSIFIKELEDEFYGKICLDKDPDNIGNRLTESKAENLKLKIRLYSVDKLKFSIKQIHKQANQDSVYHPKHRVFNFLIHEQLTERGIAPVWREMLKFYKPKKDSPQSCYACDLQMFDLFWVYMQYRGLKTEDGAWGGIFEDMFTSPEFNYTKAYQISRSELTNEKKIILLGLNDAIQEELSVIRSDKIRQRISTVKNQAIKVGMSLDEAGIRFRKRSRTQDQILVCKNVWVASKLSNNSIVEAQRKYRQIVGESINASTYRSKLKAIVDTLDAVKYSDAA